MNKLTIDDIELVGKRALVRVDFNIPLDENGSITDDLRIRASLPTIRKIIESGGRAVLMSHMGRPKGKVVPELRMTPAALRLSEYLKKEVKLAPDCVGAETLNIAEGLTDGEALLLENLRFHKEETENDPEFARQLAELGEVYINDAFGTAHRAHASTEGITHYLSPAAAGYLMEKEIEFLGRAIENPPHPFVAVLGGAKVSGKVELIERLIGRVDAILVGGGMCFTFLKAQGLNVGDSLVEEDLIQTASATLSKAAAQGAEMSLLQDVVIAREISAETDVKTVSANEIEAGWKGLDIGPRTAEYFAERIAGAQTVLWNGPMGVFETSPFAGGTERVALAMAAATQNGATTVVGGGDTAAAARKFGVDAKVSHVSTGGGASLEFLSGLSLPGLEALTDK